MKSYFRYLTLLFLALSCNNDNHQVDRIEEKESDRTEVNNPLIQQNSSNILGDKIILSNVRDENGLKSPDMVLVLKMFNDSSENNAFSPIGTKNYFFKSKRTKFISIAKNLSDSVRFKSSFKEVIYRIRPNNFEDDIHLSIEMVDSAYSNYETSWFNKSERILLIKPKKIYSYARKFIRLLKFDKNGLQKNAVTIDDFQFTDGVSTRNGYLLGLNDFGYGPSKYFVKSDYSYKVVWLDKKLNILEEFRVAHPSTELKQVDYVNNRYIVRLEKHYGCDICDWNFCSFVLSFDSNYQPQSVKISNQPRDLRVNPDSLRNEILKNKI
ncbi:MAG: hypothetical protein AAFY71_28340 [Bacteroidota bacterium]